MKSCFNNHLLRIFYPVSPISYSVLYKKTALVSFSLWSKKTQSITQMIHYFTLIL